jgi:hypothetical protein
MLIQHPLLLKLRQNKEQMPIVQHKLQLKMIHKQLQQLQQLIILIIKLLN